MRVRSLLSVIPLFDRQPHHPLVPTAFQRAVARGGGQGRPSGRRSAARLALDGREHDGPLVQSGDGAPGARPTARTFMIAGAAAALVAWLPASGFAQPAQVPARSSCAAFVAEASRRFGVPERWIVAVMRQESAGQVDAVSRAGAQGCMQVMPATWAELAGRHGLGADPFDPRDNMLAGAAYLRQMFDRYGTVDATLAAYNAGPGRYDDYRLRGRPLPAETLDYIARLGPAVAGTAPLGNPVRAPDATITAAAAPIFVRLSGGWPALNPQPDRAEASASPAPGVSPFVQSVGLFVTLRKPVQYAGDPRATSVAPDPSAPTVVTSAEPVPAPEAAPNALFVPLNGEEPRP